MDIPAEPKAKWKLLSGLNFTQHTLALASSEVIEWSIFVDQILTKKKIFFFKSSFKKKLHFN